MVIAQKIKIARLILSVGLATVFLYAALASLIHPADWVGYVPAFTAKLLPVSTTLKLFSIFQILLSVWMLAGRFVKYAATISALTMVAIIFSNLHVFAATFRDIAIVAAAVALALLSD